MTRRQDSGGKIDLDSYLPYVLNRMMARLNQNLAARLWSHGLSFQNWRVLLVLGMRGRLTLTELVEHTIIPQSTLSRLAARMDKAGHITRRPDPTNSRVVHVELTDAGRRTFDSIYPLAQQEFASMLSPLKDGEQDELNRMVLQVAAHVFAQPSVKRGRRGSA
jgi:DNA-binding MarR family transcriptional regulator